MKARTHGQCLDCHHYGSSCKCHLIDQPSRLERLEEEKLALENSRGANRFTDALIQKRLRQIAFAIGTEKMVAEIEGAA